MDFVWFVYTIAIMMVAIVACATSMVLWVITERRDCIYAAVAFATYMLGVAIILFDEYIQVKVDASEYIMNGGLIHPWIEVPLNALLVTSAWAWCLERLHIKIDWKTFGICAAAFLAFEIAFCPTQTHGGALRTFLYWGARDFALIGAVAFGFWYVKYRSRNAEKLGLIKAKPFYMAVLILLCLMLVEDIFNILIIHPDMSNPAVSNFYWHMSGRNITENITMVVLAVRKLMYNHDVMRVYAKHPAESDGTWEDERVAHDFDTRLLRFCDVKGMSVRERDVLELAIKGKDTQGIASELYISTGTVKAHMHRIYTKVGVTNRQELVNAFWKF